MCDRLDEDVLFRSLGIAAFSLSLFTNLATSQRYTQKPVSPSGLIPLRNHSVVVFANFLFVFFALSYISLGVIVVLSTRIETNCRFAPFSRCAVRPDKAFAPSVQHPSD
jgi:hypothetical protein